MPTETAPKIQWMRQTLGALVVFSGLCTVLALVLTAAEAWQEHARERWPQVTAHVDSCGLERISTGEEWYHIRCRVSYVAGGEPHVTTVRSVNVRSPQPWQYPRNPIAPLQQWIDEHPAGTPIFLHYNPANHSQVSPTDALIGGPHTQSYLKLLEVCAGSFVILLAIARITRLRLPDPVDALS